MGHSPRIDNSFAEGRRNKGLMAHLNSSGLTALAARAGCWVRSPPPLPKIRKIHVDSAALTHQPFPDLRSKGRGFAPILRPTSITRKGSIFGGNMKSKTDKLVNLGRHKRFCIICAHEKRDEIEQDFVAWKSPALIAQEYVWRTG
jgi:hypothetical protein